MNKHHHYKDGPGLAAIFSAALGCTVIGLATVLAEISPSIKGLLTWSTAVGPLSGKTGLGVLVWLGTWYLFHRLWKNWEIPFSKVWQWSLILIFLGWLGTFPPFFELFAK